MPKRGENNTFIVSFFLYLARSKKYKNFKNFFRTLFKDNKSRAKHFIDYFLIFLIVSSVAIFVYEVENVVPDWVDFYAVYVTSTIFAIEYLINMWLYNNIHESVLKEYKQSQIINVEPRYFKVLTKAFLKKLSYALTPVAIIDLLAILPAYRPLRFLRILVLFRFLKILKHSDSLNQFIDVLKDRKFELITLLLVFSFVVFMGGLGIYILEETQNKHINSLFDGIYWAFITVTTVGYGDVSPVTFGGRIVSFTIILIGITMVSFATSVIVSAFSEKLVELKEEKVTHILSKKGDFLIICGYGQLAKVFLRRSEELIKDDRYVILDKNCKKVEEATKDGYIAFCEDASRYDVLSRFIRKNSKISLLALTGSDVENIYITLNAKSIDRKIRVIAAARDKSMFNKYKRAGADRVTLPNEIASSVLTSSIAYPAIYKAVNAILSSKDIANIGEYCVVEKSSLIGKMVRDCDFQKHRVILFGVKKGDKGEFIFNPKKDYTFEVGDILVVLGHVISIKYVKRLYDLGECS